jgi:hypothetical protein
MDVADQTAGIAINLAISYRFQCYSRPINRSLKPTAVSGHEWSTKQMKSFSLIVLLICHVVFFLSLPLFIILASGLHGPRYEGTKLAILRSYPIIVPVSLIGAWVFYRQQSYGKAMGLSILPLLSLIGFMLVGLA